MLTRHAMKYGVVFAVAALVGGCVDEQPTEPRAGVELPSEATFARGKGNAHGTRGLDAEFTRIATEAPGFGGMYYDGSGKLNVHVTRDQMRARGAREAIVASVGRSLRASGRSAPSAQEVVFHEAEHDYLRLNEARERMRSILGVEGVVYTDVDETTNRLRVGVLEGTPQTRIEDALARVAVPVEMVSIVTSPAIERFAGETLRDFVQPLGGGVQIVWEYPGVGYFVCTLGFNVLRSEPGRSQPYFLTNSHCTGDQGVVTGTEYYQPAPPAFVDRYNLLGYEVLDPPFFTDPCYVGYICRWSDAALIKYYRDNPVRFGSIYRTEFYGTTGPGSIDIVDDGRKFFSIVDERPYSMVGDVLDKMGRTTGWTRGEVFLTCVDVGVSGTNQAMLCQDLVAGVAAGGDSGSPVFQPIGDSHDAILYGLLWGGGPGVFVFSPLENIRYELGDFTTH
jgi:hypothetical protein